MNSEYNVFNAAFPLTYFCLDDVNEMTTAWYAGLFPGFIMSQCVVTQNSFLYYVLILRSSGIQLAWLMAL
jgi:hypothetical protein